MADSAATFLDRMRGNVAMALHNDATLAQVQAHVLAISRGMTRPGLDEHLDGQELAEHAETLNHFRSHQPGTVPDGD